MARTSDIDSTEKLLNVIRGQDQGLPGRRDKEKTPPSRKKTENISGIYKLKSTADKKRYTIGVDFGQGFISLAKTVKTSDGRPMLLEHKIIKYDHLTSKNSPEFNSILKSALHSFCGSFANCSIWTMVTAGEANVSYLKVPRVPKKQLQNVVYWTAKKELSFDDKDSVFDFELQGEITDQGIPKYLVMVYTAPKAEIEGIKALFSDIGVPLAGITLAPFAVQNVFRSGWMGHDEGAFAALYVGDDFSRIDIYHGENLAMTRVVKTGISSMVEAIADAYVEKEKKFKLEADEAKKILFSLGPDSEKLSRTDAGFGLREEEIMEMIFPVWERLARQIERTLQYYTSSVGYKKVESFYIASSMNAYNPLVIYMNDQLGITTEYFDLFSDPASYPAVESLNLSERILLVSALGLSLSDSKRTPSAIFTYLDKNKAIRIARINRGIFASFAAALIVCIVAIVYQAVEMSSLSAKRAQKERELSAYNPVLSTEQISKMAEEVKKYTQGTKKYAQRYLAPAAIGEVSSITPGNIKLINLKVGLPAANPKPAAGKAASDSAEDLVVEGVIFGQRDMLQSLLAQYVMKLENSPMFKKVTINKTSYTTFRKSEILHFTLNAQVG
ncbi:MAG: pilus assembly protein PilM [Syntrophaceae bacterium]|nr:pilus assembly protein PilM [Syntrophaceae bacterium]